ncbi:MAG: bifunctional folylpolyglutamate synthase/dihydrofolate synthase [Deltaproteobacteria bacterium]|nr:bifunctional folylpolyglutamate synthase/dihydrofolate synthase [Deltaproteobacteria bacterium]
MKTYKDVLNYLYSLQKYGIKFGLSKTSNILKALGNPHHGQRYIHVAGTNGKGSVAAMLESIFINAGLKVGFYSSPHLVRFTERFRINRKEIPKHKVVELTRELIEVINPKQQPTYFEVTTAMALVYFARENTDIAIMEVGMGGRLDATNVIKPMVCGITNISLEHQFFLGSTLEQIAGEKAGIIKKGIDVVTAVTQPTVTQVIQKTCFEKKAPLWRVGKDIRYRTIEGRLNYYGLRENLHDIHLGLKGRHQYRNATMVIAMIEILREKGLTISTRDTVQGLRETAWPGRMQIISTHPIIMLDGAHNPMAIQALRDSLRKEPSFKRLILVLGVMEDKDIKGITRGIVPLADYTIYTRPVYYRAAKPEYIQEKAAPLKKPGEVVPLLTTAIEKAKYIARPDDLILITGSLFTVGEALTYFDPKKYKADGI